MQPYAETRDGPGREDRLAENGAMVQLDKEVIQRGTKVKPAAAVSGDNLSVFINILNSTLFRRYNAVIAYLKGRRYVLAKSDATALIAQLARYTRYNVVTL